MLAVLLTVFLSGHALDTGLTLRALAQGGVREANPVLAPFTASPVAFSLAKGGLALGASVALWHGRTAHPRLVKVALIVLSAAVWTANLRELQRRGPSP